MGDSLPEDNIVYAMRHTHEQMMTNMSLLRPGIRHLALVENSHKLDHQFDKGKHGMLMHGVGLCDEWLIVSQPDQWLEGSFDYVLEPGMSLCVEALGGAEGGDFAIKLEGQVLITDDGYENLTRYPFDPVLMGGLSCMNVSLQPLGSGTDSCAALHQNTAPGSRAKQKLKLVQVGDPEYM